MRTAGIRFWVIVSVTVAAAVLLAAIIIPPRLQPAEPAGPAIATKALGSWQETDSREAYRLTIARDAQAQGGVWYTVTYPRSFKVPFPASLNGGTITIWGENTSDPVWLVTYDETRDVLQVARPNGSEMHTLSRVRGGLSDPPAWLRRQARLMARQGSASEAWWTKTTLEEALRAVEPGHWQRLTKANSKPVYLLVMRGAFMPFSNPGGGTQAPVRWGSALIDPRTHLVDEFAGTNSRPRTDGLDMRELFL